MGPNPRLRLPFDPDTEGIWKYYKVIKITPVVIDKLLVILLTIPILDSTLELNIYRVHNLPVIPLGHKIATTYLLEGITRTTSQSGNMEYTQHCLMSGPSRFA